MERTVVCYLIDENDKYLMLYRNKKKVDPNHGKWITVGGHIEEGESPMEAVIREVKEETGFDITNPQKLGVVNFKGDFFQEMHVYICHEFSGNMIPCDEGELAWFTKDEVLKLNMWEGDYKFIYDVFLENTFNLELTYTNDKLTNTKKY